jgi:hypothetical protein
MTLDELVDWVDDAMVRLPSSKDTAHLRRMYAQLDGVGVEWAFRRASWRRG